MTCLVNSGSLLETLVRSQVDLVLHGHEHEHNWVVYNSCGPDQEPVRVVGAGSATGKGEKSCHSDRMTFNLIILLDRSVRLRRFRWYGGRWEVDDDVPLFDASGLRRLCIPTVLWLPRCFAPKLRSMSSSPGYARHLGPLGYRNWLLPAGDFVRRISNTTGEPDAWEVELWFADGAGDASSSIRCEATCEPVPGEDCTWEIRWPAKPEWAGKIVNMKT